MHTVFDVAKYILQKSGRLTTWKLQKLVYYCQAWSLAWDEVPLFEEEFEAWDNGPVCRELFYKHQGKFEVTADEIPGNTTNFSLDEIETMDTVLSSYGNKPAYWLRELTHKEAPWRNARGDFPVGQYCSNVISKESMQDYYSSLS